MRRRFAAGLLGRRTSVVLGWQEDVTALLSSADCFLLPSEAETSALGMLEAMACGIPGIVSATPGTSARRPDGVLLVANELGAWIAGLRAIDRLGPAGRAEAGRVARAWVEAHGDAARSNELWLALVENSISQTRSAGRCP